MRTVGVYVEFMNALVWLWEYTVLLDNALPLLKVLYHELPELRLSVRWN